MHGSDGAPGKGVAEDRAAGGRGHGVGCLAMKSNARMAANAGTALLICWAITFRLMSLRLTSGYPLTG